MRLNITALIGFLVLTLCPNVCPMNMEMAAMDMGTDHSMHAMQNTDRATPCEHCAEHSLDELALTNVTPVIQTASIASIIIDANTIFSFEYEEVGIPRSDLASAGPPITPSIVSTIVLRT